MIKQVFAIATLSAVAVLAQMPPTTQERTRPTPEQMVEHRVARMATLLSLTTTQQAQIRTILLDEMSAASALRSTAETAHTNLKAAVESRAGDAQIEAAASQVGLVQGQMAAVHAKAQVKLRGALTAEQLAKLEALPGGGGHRPGGPGGMRGPGGPGGPGGFGGRGGARF